MAQAWQGCDPATPHGHSPLHYSIVHYSSRKKVSLCAAMFAVGPTAPAPNPLAAKRYDAAPSVQQHVTDTLMLLSTGIGNTLRRSHKVWKEGCQALEPGGYTYTY